MPVVQLGRGNRHAGSAEGARTDEQAHAPSPSPGNELGADRQEADDAELETENDDRQTEHCSDESVVDDDDEKCGRNHDARAHCDTALFAPCVGEA